MKGYLDGNLIYPYNELVKTRDTMYCKWVIMQSERANPNLGAVETVYHKVLCKAFTPDTVQKLMITKHALPLPPDLSYCMDEMDAWGADMDKPWYCDVVGMLAFTVEDGIPVNRKGIVLDSIDIKMRMMVYTYFAPPSNTAHMLMEDWIDWFYVKWDTDTQSFKQLYIDSCNYMNTMLATMQNLMAQPVRVVS